MNQDEYVFVGVDAGAFRVRGQQYVNNNNNDSNSDTTLSETVNDDQEVIDVEIVRQPSEEFIQQQNIPIADPVPAEEIEAQDDTNRRELTYDNKKKNQWMLGVMTLMVLLVIGIVVGIVVSKKNQNGSANSASDNNQENKNTNQTTISPTKAPSSLPTIDSRPADIEQALLPISGSLLLDQDSFQYEAINWIVFDDPAQLDIDVASTSIRQLQERYIVALFYFSLEGYLWTEQYGFLSEASICNWNDGNGNGIQCNMDGFVSEISFENNNLKGRIPSEITELSSLIRINTAHDDIDGTIDSMDWSNLSLLQYLGVAGSSMGGTIPPLIFELPNFQTFNISGSSVGGNIPETIVQATNLIHFSASGCGLEGSIPNDWTNVTNLEFFDVRRNNMGGSIPSSITLLPNLRYFDVGNNFMTGALPDFDGQVTMEHSHFEENMFKGTLPSSITSLPNLSSLNVCCNQLTGTIPPLSQNNGTLYFASFEENSFTNNFESLLVTIPSDYLWRLYISNNQLTGTIPTEITKFEKLETFSIWENKLEGTVPTEIGLLNQLEWFRLSTNQFTGNIPSEIGLLTNLVFLTLSTNFFTGTVPMEFSNLVNITTLSLQGNMLTGNLNSIFCPDGGDTWPQTLQADCADTLPEVFCDCCTFCF